MIVPHLNTSLKIGTVTVAIFAILNLIGANLLATQGEQLSQIYDQTGQIKKENAILANDIAAETSLASLESWADARGFVKISKPIALTTPAPVAYLPR